MGKYLSSKEFTLLLVGLSIGLAIGVFFSTGISEKMNADGPPAVEGTESAEIEKLAGVPYGERGVWKIEDGNTTCYYAQTYSGSGYAVSIDCLGGNTDE